jgi:hypothetical protein
MELYTQDTIHFYVLLHPLFDAESICTYTGAGEGMEVWGGLSGRKCASRTVRDDDL